jgi:hypothetical protein
LGKKLESKNSGKIYTVSKQLEANGFYAYVIISPGGVEVEESEEYLNKYYTGKSLKVKLDKILKE